ncbi:glutamate decarboxylase [Synechococcus sp. UW179A]|uniref:glutamate decarboxylase n=1 Tax=Synechococcus sp. UW179A TaxID=2575510 RepID=UPI000E0F902D|nr:glutamate decarboxylase [Synechococcus sp. UW179A]
MENSKPKLDLETNLGHRLDQRKMKGLELPRYELSKAGIQGDLAYRLIHDHLMLDGNAMLNLATFVGTWMEPEALNLMRECVDKNMIDKDEYPQTAELENRCIRMLARLWHAPDPDQAIGTSTTGSSEACMLGGMVLRWHWRQRRKKQGLDDTQPNLVMGTNTQICWDKFCAYFDVEPRMVPISKNHLQMTAEGAIAACDENTIGVVGVLGSTFDGSYEPIKAIQEGLDLVQQEKGLDIPIHVDGASGAFVAPFNSPSLLWDFQLPRVKSINTSGHKYGGVVPGVGWVLWREQADLPEELRFNVNYLGGQMPTIGMNFSRPGAQIVGQYFNFIHLGHEGYCQRMASLESTASYIADSIEAMGTMKLLSHPKGQLPVFAVAVSETVTKWTVFQMSDRLRMRGWQVPAYTMPANCEDLAVLRFVIRAGFTRDMADLLLQDIRNAIEWFEKLNLPMPDPNPEHKPFHH